MVNWTVGPVENLSGAGMAVEISDDMMRYSAVVPVGVTPKGMADDFASAYDFNGSEESVPCHLRIYSGDDGVWEQVECVQFECVPYTVEAPDAKGYVRR